MKFPQKGPSYLCARIIPALIVFLKEFFENVNFENYLQMTKKTMNNYPACNEVISTHVLISAHWVLYGLLVSEKYISAKKKCFVMILGYQIVQCYPFIIHLIITKIWTVTYIIVTGNFNEI